MRPEQAPLLRIARANLSRLIKELMPNERSSAQRASGIARSRLNPDVIEWSFAQQPSIGNAVERDTAGQHEVLHFGLTRSEEHTSELQSRLHLVCRLLLEKKKK